MAKRKRPQAKRAANEQATPRIVTSEYEITSEPILEPQYKRLPEEIKVRIEQLHAVVQTRPRTAIPELHTLIETYPHIPLLYNFLSAAYTAAGETEKAEEAILDNYQRNPDYVFARINYAELCLQRKEYDKIAQILDEKFDLKLLYPKRKRFHMTELTGFFGVVGPYFHFTGQRALAENIYRILHQVAPQNYYTKRLKKLLYPNFFQRIFQSQNR